MASADAARQAIWLRLLLDDLQLGLGNKPFPIMNHNAGTIALSKKSGPSRTIQTHWTSPSFPPRASRRQYFLIPSADNIADLLTKGLPRELFDRLRDLLGVTARSDRVGSG